MRMASRDGRPFAVVGLRPLDTLEDAVRPKMVQEMDPVAVAQTPLPFAVLAAQAA